MKFHKGTLIRNGLDTFYVIGEPLAVCTIADGFNGHTRRAMLCLDGNRVQVCTDIGYHLSNIYAYDRHDAIVKISSHRLYQGERTWL